MATIVKKLNDYIEEVDERAGKNSIYSLKDIRGISSITKLFQKTKANLVDVSTTGYKVVKPMEFAFNPNTARMGDKIPIALNLEPRNILVSSIYPVFRVKNPDQLDPQYLWLYFKRSEFDRYARFKSHGSAREIFSWDEMCNISIPIPSIDLQREIVKQYSCARNAANNLLALNEHLDKLAKAILKSAIADHGKCKEGTFSDLIIGSYGGDWGKEGREGNYTEKVICFRGTDLPDLQNGIIENAPTRYILPKNLTNKRIGAEDLIIEISGGSPVQSTGRIALVDDIVQKKCNGGIVCSNFCRSLKVKEGYRYIFYTYWKNIYDNGIMFNYENSSTGLKNFDYSAFVSEETIFIPDSNQVEEKLKKIYQYISRNGSLIKNLDELSSKVMPNSINKLCHMKEQP